MKKFILVLIFTVLASLPAGAAEPLRVVASFSILADMVKSVGGDAVAVTSLVKADEDAHSFQSSPKDVKALAKAEMIVINGLGFEGWIARLIDSSGAKGTVVIASEGVKPRLMDEHGKEAPDPHAWQNLANGRIYVKNIAAALARALPHHAKAIQKRAADYDAQLIEMDRDVRAKLDAFPRERRKIITSHDAFGYFGDAYGVTFLAPLGVNEEAEPSAYDVARLIKQMRENGIKLVFIENMTNPKLIRQIGADAGAKIGGTLYSDALSKENGDAPTYLDLFRNNVSKFLDALASMPTKK